jgi:acetoacetyl-CoA synthetase
MPSWDRRIVWEPPDDAWTASRMGRFLARVGDERGLDLATYERAWEWSTTDLEGFWSEIVREFDIELTDPPTSVLSSRAMPGARWFEGATLNYARDVLTRGSDEHTAIIGESQSRGRSERTFAELRRDVARFAAGLRSLGVKKGDRVAAYLPNAPEAVVAFMATASIGAVWSSCAPEFGVRAVVDRFVQIEPMVLLVITGYRYGARTIDRTDDVVQLLGDLPSVRTAVVLDHLDGATDAEALAGRIADTAREPAAVVRYADLLTVEPDTALEFTDVPFDHPLYVLYSSGSTGLPKPIVHGHGGILLEHLKMLGLHHDLDEGDVFLWFSTVGWMVWNYLVTALALGTTIVTFDGDPSSPGLDEIWRVAARTGVTVLGLGAPSLVRCDKEDLPLPEGHDLSRLRQIGSTGAPLPPGGFEWVERRFGRRVQVVSVSGGTDLCTAFVAGAPVLPVHVGELQCRCLGAYVDAFDDEGRSVVGSLGEMVIRAPMPSMPVGFWGDDGSRYRAAYFEHFPGIWRHGDWLEITEDGTCIITGRSDATLNRGGIRSGTAEFTSIVEVLEGVVDSLVVHLEDPDGGPGELVLLVALAPGVQLDDELTARVRAALRAGISPRHVPDRIVEVPTVPRTISGKKVEVPVKRLLTGADPDAVVTRDALAEPAAWAGLVDAVRAAGLLRAHT